MVQPAETGYKSDWVLSHAIETAPRSIPYVVATRELGEESDLPADELDESFELTQETSVKIYDAALGRSDLLPVVIGIPHGGELVPQDMWDQAKPSQRYAFGSEVGLDVGTISLFEPRNNRHVGVRARVSRVVDDANRTPDDDGTTHPSGRGIMWLRSFDNQPIFDPEPTKEQIRDHVDLWYTRYYQALQALAGTLLDQGYKNVLHVDGHSYLSHLPQPSYGIEANTPMPLFILGTHELKDGGPSIDPRLADVYAQTLEEELPDWILDHPAVSQKVGLNKPFGGVWNVERWGLEKGIQMPPSKAHPNGFILPQRVQSIQVETNNTAFFQDKKYDHRMLDAMRHANDRAIEKTVDVMQSLV